MSITPLFVKTGKKKPDELGKVFHYDLFGKREAKYDFLVENTLRTVDYKELPNVAPNYFFVSKDFDEQKIYNEGFPVNELFTLNNVGIVTARDEFTIHNSKEEVQNTITEFLSLDDEFARTRFNLGIDVRDWQVNFAKKDLQSAFPDKGKFSRISYRPFDDRWTFYTGKTKGFHCYPRNEVMQHFVIGNNVGLVMPKQIPEQEQGSCFITKYISGHKLCSAYNINNIFPLYLYPETTAQQTIGQSSERTPNLNKDIVKQIAEGLGAKFVPEPDLKGFKNLSGLKQEEEVFAPIDLLDYIYAVLHSPSYREKYKEFLKIDFPRVPYPKTLSKFRTLTKLGSQLRQIHLLESPGVEDYITQYPEGGDNVVGKIRFEPSTSTLEGFETLPRFGKVYINDTQHFANVPEVAFNFYIGGYQPAQKWLKDRKDRKLEFDDILHYQKIIVALTETDRLMKAIDRVEIE